jgi:paraquat-inducible protein B
MNAKEALQEIKSLLFKEDSKQKFAMSEGKLEDGTIVKYDVETNDIFVVGQDGVDVPAPVGEHKLETGEVIVVTEEGKIAEIKKSEDEGKVEVEIEAAEEEKKEEKPNLEEEMSSMKSKYEDLEKKVDEMAKKMDEMGKANEKMSQALNLSAQVLETLAKEPSAEAIQKPNTFHSQMKNKKEDNYNKLQQVFQNLKSK